ncbi:MAG TPA: transposase [Terriglobia bacterium]|nr:transposase [Terriglobia bacterium]
MDETQNQAFQLSFNPSLKGDFQGSRVTSEGGLILGRELDERLGFGELIERHLTDSRRGKNTRFPFAELLWQSVYTLASQAGAFLAGADFGDQAGVDGKVSESSVGKAALSGCRGPNGRANGRLPSSLRGSKIRRAITF